MKTLNTSEHLPLYITALCGALTFRLIALAALITALAIGACQTRQAPASPTTHGNPLASITRQAPEALQGVVRQRHRASSYTYLLVEGADGAQRWAVVMGQGPAQGDTVRLTVWATHPRFHSASLRRDFAPLRFASVARP